MIVERLFPASRERPWVGRVGLAIAGLALAAVMPLLWEESVAVSVTDLVLGAGLVLALVVAAFLAPRRPARSRQPRAPGWTAFGCTAAHFVLTYAVADTGLPWPVGVALALAPVALGVALLWGSADPLRPLTGVLAFFGLLAVAVGLAGRVDLSLAGVAVLGGAWWLRRRPPP